MSDRPALPPPYVPASLDFGDSRAAEPASPGAIGAASPTGLAPGKGGKLYRVGIRREDGMLYFIKEGDIWAVGRQQPGKARRKPVKLTSIGFTMDFGKYLYYVDGDGDIAVKPRQVGGR